MVLNKGKRFSDFMSCHSGTTWFSKPDFAFVVLKSAVTSCDLLAARSCRAARRLKVSWLSISHISRPLLLIIIEGLRLAD